MVIFFEFEDNFSSCNEYYDYKPLPLFVGTECANGVCG